MKTKKTIASLLLTLVLLCVFSAVSSASEDIMLSDDATVYSMYYSINGGREYTINRAHVVAAESEEGCTIYLDSAVDKNAHITINPYVHNTGCIITKNSGVTLVDGAGTANVYTLAENGSTTMKYTVNFIVSEVESDYTVITVVVISIVVIAAIVLTVLIRVKRKKKAAAHA